MLLTLLNVSKNRFIIWDIKTVTTCLITNFPIYFFYTEQSHVQCVHNDNIKIKNDTSRILLPVEYS